MTGRSRRCVVAALLSLHRVTAWTRLVGVWARRGSGSSRRGVVVSLHRRITVSRVASRSAASIPPCVAAVVCCYAVVLFLLGCCAAAGMLVGACVRDCPFWFFISVHRGSLSTGSTPCSDLHYHCQQQESNKMKGRVVESQPVICMPYSSAVMRDCPGPASRRTEPLRSRRTRPAAFVFWAPPGSQSIGEKWSGMLAVAIAPLCVGASQPLASASAGCGCLAASPRCLAGLLALYCGASKPQCVPARRVVITRTCSTLVGGAWPSNADRAAGSIQ